MISEASQDNDCRAVPNLSARPSRASSMLVDEIRWFFPITHLGLSWNLVQGPSRAVDVFADVPIHSDKDDHKTMCHKSMFL